MPEQPGERDQTQMVYRPKNGLSNLDNLKVERQQDSSFETLWQGKGSAGNLSYHHINTREGVDIWRFQHISTQPAKIISQKGIPAIALRFCLQGEAHRYYTGMNRRFIMKGGQQDLFYTNDIEDVSSTPVNQALDLIGIFISKECFMSWFADDDSLESAKLHSVLMGNDNTFFCHNGKMRRDTLRVLNRMIQCPHTGIIRKLFYESCSLELLSLQLNDLRKAQDANHSCKHYHRGLHPDERRRIRRIVERFNDNPGEVPSLTDLAREAGMSQSKLSRLFRLEYGMTVFTYLRNTRLDLAAQMLCQGMTVTETAFSVGYENLSHFTKMFKMRFGRLPSRF